MPRGDAKSQIPNPKPYTPKSVQEELCREVKLNTKRYVQLIANAIDELLPEPDQQYQEEDVFDVMLHQRMQVVIPLPESGNLF